MNPDMEAEKAETLVRDFILNQLHVQYYYLSTIVVRKNALDKGVRIFNRYSGTGTAAGIKHNTLPFYAGWVERK